MTADLSERFRADTANHVLTVLRDDGIYRHLRLAAPRSNTYWFDLVTWPGHLAITGDMDCFVFARTKDMFEFFRSGHGINPMYWGEKVIGGAGVKGYSEARFRQIVTEYVDDVEADHPAGLRAAVQAEVLDDPDIYYEAGARQAVEAFEFEGAAKGIVAGLKFRFEDTWEWDLQEDTHHFLWCCHAIKWGIAQYDAARVAVASTVGGAS
jgi:hypothetical protein